jgi:ABC-2 type transport system permease protein
MSEARAGAAGPVGKKRRQGGGSDKAPMITSRVVDAPLAPPWAEQGLLEVFRHRYILSLLVRREIAARYQGSVLGLVWSYVNPLTQFFIYYFVMGILFGRAQVTEAFAIHVFAGLIIVHFFIETMNAGTRSIVRNKSLVQKMAVPREMFPVASMLVSLFHVIPQVVILVVATFLAGWRPDLWGLAHGVLAMLIIMSLGTALALVFSAANVFLRDVSNAVNVLSNFVRFGVPMMYPYTLVAHSAATPASTSPTRSPRPSSTSSVRSGSARPAIRPAPSPRTCRLTSRC